VFGKIGSKAGQREELLKVEEKQITTIGNFCLNEACEDYQKVNHGNIIKQM
jgi:hypothetical protein